MKLLSVDWDYFFPTPWLKPDDEIPTDGSLMLWDWGHKESPFFMDAIWPVRAAGFLRNGFELPTVNDEWRTFWSRFQFSEGAQLYLSNSHCYGAHRKVNDGIEQVWSYDAHHDLGYGRNPHRRIVESGHIKCDDWLLALGMSGREIEVRYPSWHGGDEGPLDPLPDSMADIKLDDGLPVAEVFDRVIIAQSQSWTPPWSDDAWEEFVGLCPLEVTKKLDDCRNRGFDLEAARQMAEMDSKLMAQAGR